MSELRSPIPGFVADWLQREPALAICNRFAVNPMQWLASVIVIEELWQAMFALSNQELAQAKLAWWADEADLAVSGAPRHPLTQALAAEKADLRALPALVQAALEWITLPTAPDANAQTLQFSTFSTAASAWVGEADCAAIWAQLALKRQLQSYAKPERYGPNILSRAALAEFQLKASQIGDADLVAAPLSANLTAICQKLNATLPKQAPGTQSATRAYGLLHAREAKHWGKVIMAKPGVLTSIEPGFIGLFQAWSIARA